MRISSRSGSRRGRVKSLRNRSALSKRRRFFLVSVILGICLFFIQGLSVERRVTVLLFFALLSYLLSAWSLMKDLNGIEWISDLILPTMFPVAVGFFYFLLPQILLVRVIVLFLFVIGVYALLLTANIFAVASIRTIQLLRAARAVGFLFSVLTGAFLFQLILSFRLDFYWNGLLVWLISSLLFLQGLWSSELSSYISARVFKYTVVGSFVMMEFAVALSFLPVEAAMGSIFLSMVMYIVLGIMQHILESRLFRKTMNEYLSFGFVVFVIVMVSAWIRWNS